MVCTAPSRNILEQHPTQGHIYHLKSPANCENWLSQLDKLFGKLQFNIVSGLVIVLRRVDGTLSVAVRIDVNPSSEQKSIGNLDILLQTGGFRYNDGKPACLCHPLEVVAIH